jgi:hypothetical protein
MMEKQLASTEITELQLNPAVMKERRLSPAVMTESQQTTGVIMRIAADFSCNDGIAADSTVLMTE